MSGLPYARSFLKLDVAHDLSTFTFESKWPWPWKTQAAHTSSCGTDVQEPSQKKQPIFHVHPSIDIFSIGALGSLRASGRNRFEGLQVAPWTVASPWIFEFN